MNKCCFELSGYCDAVSTSVKWMTWNLLRRCCSHCRQLILSSLFVHTSDSLHVLLHLESFNCIDISLLTFHDVIFWLCSEPSWSGPFGHHFTAFTSSFVAIWLLRSAQCQPHLWSQGSFLNAVFFVTSDFSIVDSIGCLIAHLVDFMHRRYVI